MARQRATYRKDMGEKGTVYLLHFMAEDGTHGKVADHAGHYLGWSRNVEGRLAHHKAGSGNPLVYAAVQQGLTPVIAKVWEGVDRHFERRLKNRKGAPRLCPICRGEA